MDPNASSIDSLVLKPSLNDSTTERICSLDRVIHGDVNCSNTCGYEGIDPRTSTLLLMTFFLLALMLNVPALVMVVLNRRMQEVRNVYTAALAAADLLVSLNSVLGVVWVQKRGLNENNWLCSFFKVYLQLTLCFSLVTLLLVSVDRLIYIRYPFFYICSVTHWRATVLISLSWLVCLVYVLLTRVVYNSLHGAQADFCCGHCDIYALVYQDRLVAYVNSVFFLLLFTIPFLAHVLIWISAVKQARKLSKHKQTLKKNIKKTCGCRCKLFSCMYGDNCLGKCKGQRSCSVVCSLVLKEFTNSSQQKKPVEQHPASSKGKQKHIHGNVHFPQDSVLEHRDPLPAAHNGHDSTSPGLTDTSIPKRKFSAAQGSGHQQNLILKLANNTELGEKDPGHQQAETSGSVGLRPRSCDSVSERSSLHVQDQTMDVQLLSMSGTNSSHISSTMAEESSEASRGFTLAKCCSFNSLRCLKRCSAQNKVTDWFSDSRRDEVIKTSSPKRIFRISRKREKKAKPIHMVISPADATNSRGASSCATSVSKLYLPQKMPSKKVSSSTEMTTTVHFRTSPEVEFLAVPGTDRMLRHKDQCSISSRGGSISSRGGSISSKGSMFSSTSVSYGSKMMELRVTRFRVARKLLGVFVSLVLCWVPIIVLGLLGPTLARPSQVATIAFLAMLNSAANALVYAWSDSDMKAALRERVCRRIMCCFLSKNRVGVTITSSPLDLYRDMGESRATVTEYSRHYQSTRRETWETILT